MAKNDTLLAACRCTFLIMRTLSLEVPIYFINQRVVKVTIKNVVKVQM